MLGFIIQIGVYTNVEAAIVKRKTEDFAAPHFAAGENKTWLKE